MQAIERVLPVLEDIERAGAERIVERGLHAGSIFLELGLTVDHLAGRRPARPGALVLDTAAAAPGEAVTTDAAAIAHRLAVAQHQIEEAVRRIDDDGAGNFRGREIHDPAAIFRLELPEIDG